MSNSNRFTLTSPSFNVLAETATGLQASFGQEVFLPSTWTEAEALLNQEGTIDLQGNTYVRENGGNWDRLVMNQDDPVTVNNGSLTGMLKLQQAGNTWSDLGGGLWSCTTDNISGTFGWTDYDSVARTTITLQEAMDASRATAHLIEPTRSYYDGQPQVAVYPPPPVEYTRYPTCLSSSTWLPIVSINGAGQTNGTIQVDGTNKIIGFTVTDTDLKTTIRSMVTGLTGAASGSPEKLMVIMRSGPNDIADANIESWTDAGGASDIVITLMQDSTKLKLSGSGYLELIFTGDRSFISRPGDWVTERTGYVNTMTQQQACASSKTIYYKPVDTENAPDPYYPVCGTMVEAASGTDVTFNDVKFLGCCIPGNVFTQGSAGYVIKKTGYYDYDFATETHSATMDWITLNRCTIGYSWFGVRGQVKMFDCFATDVVRNTTALSDGTECRRNVFSAAYTYETVVVLGLTGSSAAANIPKRRSVVTDNLFYQEPTLHGQGLSFYNDANMNFECTHNLFLNCQRAWSMQPDTNYFYRNCGVTAPDGNQIISNNVSIFDDTMDKDTDPGQSTFANNGGSDFYLQEPPQIYVEHNTVVIRPNMTDEMPLFADDSSITPRWTMDFGAIGFSQVQFRNNLAGRIRMRDYDPDDWGTVADIASLPASPGNGDTYFVTSELATDYPTRTWNHDIGEWIRMAAQQDRALIADLAALTSVSDNLHIVYVEENDTSYQLRSGVWVALAEHPYSDNSLLGREKVYLEGNLTCTDGDEAMRSSLDIGLFGQYTEIPSTYSMIVYSDNSPVTATAAFDTAGAQSLKPGALWTDVPTPNVIRAWIADNFNPETTDSATWYTTYPENASFDSAIVPTRLSSAQFTATEISTPDAFLTRESVPLDLRPVS